MIPGPLTGLRVVVTRAADQADGLIERLKESGAVPVGFPTIAVTSVPAPQLAAQVAQSDWIVFTSANGVHGFFDGMGDSVLPPHVGLAAVGPATAGALAARGHTADAIPETFDAVSLAEAVPITLGARILLPQGTRARDDLAAALSSAGAEISRVVVYRNTTGRPTDRQFSDLRLGFDAITFTSPSTVSGFLELAGEQDALALLKSAGVACIGPVTARAASKAGVRVDVIAKPHTTEGLFDALVRYFRESSP